jgi:hypothetical protein
MIGLISYNVRKEAFTPSLDANIEDLTFSIAGGAELSAFNKLIDVTLHHLALSVYNALALISLAHQLKGALSDGLSAL